MEEEQQLLECISTLHFHQFDFHGYLAKRRIMVYGWDYDFSSGRAEETQPIPDYLMPLRDRVAVFAELEPSTLVEAVVTEYPAGAPIGWHRDVPQFEEVIGVSLANSCRMQFKPYKSAEKSRPVSVTLEPRSIYLLRGPVRWQWQHSIPAVDALRYSITFRTLRRKTRVGRAA